MDEIETVVVGAGVIGLAIARKLALSGQEVLVLEAEEKIAQHTSSRNSQVIHAGIYYPPGSWRARLCVSGKEMLYDYCVDRHVPFDTTQKLIVAVNADHLAKLSGLIANAMACDVNDLEVLNASEAQALEPELSCKGAILSPSTGILDAPAYILSLLGEAEAAGAFLALGAPLLSVSPVEDGYQLAVGDSEGTRIKCRNLVNAAGLGAWDVARGIAGYPSTLVPEQNWAKGNWFSIAGKMPFERLIYPVPDDESLGVHYVRDLGGGFRFGPDLQYLQSSVVDYSQDATAANAFETSVRLWWPDVPTGAMQPDGCGIRPRVRPAGQFQSDFLFLGPADHGMNGLVQLFAIESPGLTASLAIAGVVAEMLGADQCQI